MYDVLIIGGGLVGSSLACALEPLGLRVGMVEATPGARGAASGPPAFDERNLALAAASLNALDALGVLPHLVTPPAPIRRIHVSRRGDFGAVRLDAREFGRDAFGGVVVARELGAALEARLAQLRTLQRHRPAVLTGLEVGTDHVEVAVSNAAAPAGSGDRLRARVLVAADGTASPVRQAMGITTEVHDYRQTLFVCSLAAARPPDGTAWERFSDSGPIALLPRPDGHYGAIMGVSCDEADAVAALGDGDYLALFQDRFGGRAGRLLRAGRRSRYPISRCVAGELVAPRVVLVGNAAQTMHPIGAQGFNLGLRDALTLAQVMAGPDAATDPGAPQVLSRYPLLRAQDRGQTLEFSDGLARVTSNPGFGMHALRSLGLLALERMPGAKARLASGAMGFRGQVPRLARSAPGRHGGGG